MRSVGERPSESGVWGTIAILSAGRSPYLDEVLARVGTEPGCRRLLVWSGPADQVPRPDGWKVVAIPNEDFDHGGTRNLALRHSEGPVLVFLSDDATPVGVDWSSALRRPLDDPKVAVVFGRQSPRPDANLGEKVFRAFSYPEFPIRSSLGVVHGRALPISNAHTAYRVAALRSVGGFPEPCSYAEDRLVVSDLIRQEWEAVYSPDAIAMHSHPTSIRSAFLRGFRLRGVRSPISSVGGAVRRLPAFAYNGFGLSGLFAGVAGFAARWLGLRAGQVWAALGRIGGRADAGAGRP